MDLETKDRAMELAETASGAAELLRVLAASEVDGATRDALGTQKKARCAQWQRA